MYSTQFNNVRRHAWWQVTRELLAIVYEHVVPKVRGVPVNDDLCHDIVLFSATFNDFYLLQRYPQVFSTNNHSRKPMIRMNGIVKDTFSRLLYQEMQNNTFDETDTETTLSELRNVFYDCAKRSKVPVNTQRAETSTQSPATKQMI